jgi:putative transposase
MIIFGPAHLEHVVKNYTEHYHHERPHQGIGNEIITPLPQGTGKIECKERLGGLLKFYRRAA